MNFLSPGLLFGLLAASIPILIHLLNLRKLKKIDFSTLHFLKLIEKQKVRRVKLIQWLLMALRVLIIAMLVLGFSRPVIQDVRIPGFTSASKTSAVIVIDDSFSMEVVDGRGSYFNQVKNGVNMILTGLKEGDDVSILFTSESYPELATPSGDFLNLKKIISQVEPGFKTGMLNSAIIKAASIIGESENLNKELYIFSDFQKSTLGNEKEFTDVSALLDSRVKTRLFNFNSKEVVNSAVTGVKVNNQVFEPGKDISVTATIRNFSEDDVNNGLVSLFVNGERGAQKSYNLAAGKITDVTLSARVEKPGFSEIRVEIDEDDLKADNSRFASIYLPYEFKVVLLGKASDLKFINAAIEAGSFAGNMQIIRKEISQTGSLDFNEVNLVIVSGAGGGDLSKLKNYVKQGGGIMLFPGENTTLAEFSTLLSSFGVVAPAELKKDAKALPGKFTSIRFEHPLLREIFQTQYGNSVESPELFTYFRIPSGSGTDIISLSDGGSFLKETRFGKGKVVTSAAAAVIPSGNFPVIPIFAPLIYRSLFYLASQEPAGEESLIGEQILIPGKKTGGGSIELAAPGETGYVLQTSANNGGVVFDKTVRPGVYKFTRDGKEIDYIPVNLDTVESNSKQLSVSEIENYFQTIKIKNDPEFFDPAGNFVQKISESRVGSELWKLFIIIALGLIAVEMYITWIKKRDRAK
ncbi:MAG: BatA domain-containing protein [Ignavibacteriales bacterium]|nr:BatA domain-containing protein [Ignavibacteriales bacterium]